MVRVRPVRSGRYSPANRWWVVSGMGLAVFMASLDLSIVNLALPAIREALGESAAVTQWVVLGYLLPLVALALPAGRWLDAVDHRDALVLAATGFGTASVLAGLAPSIGWLITARVLQGLFGSVLMALIPVLITTSTHEQVRGRAMGLVDTLGTLGLIAGPPAGGLLVATLGWPWIFALNVPVCAALVVIAVRHVPRHGRLSLPERGGGVESLLLTGTTGIVMLAFTLAAGRDPLWLALGLLAVPVFLVWRRRPTSEPVREVVTLPRLRAPLAALAGASTAVGLLFYIVPFYLFTVLRTSGPVAGLTLLAFPTTAAILAPLAGLLADRYGSRRIAIAGMAILVCGLLSLTPAGQSWDAGDVAWRLALAGAGMGLFNAPNMSAAMSAAPAALLATTGAATSVARQAGFALGPAVATLVWGMASYGIGGIRGAFAVAAVVVVAGAVLFAHGMRPQSDESDRPR